MRPIYHFVLPGESLGVIARKYGTTVKALRAANPQIDNPHLIKPDQRIHIPRTEHNWLDIARAELGQRGKPGPEHNPRIIQYHRATTLQATSDEVPWCSSFANWCMERAGIRGTRSAAARSWLKWGRELKEPRRGCVVVLRRGRNPAAGHVGFYMGERKGRIILLGGNQGNRVCTVSFPARDLLGYRWPE